MVHYVLARYDDFYTTDKLALEGMKAYKDKGIKYSYSVRKNFERINKSAKRLAYSRTSERNLH